MPPFSKCIEIAMKENPPTGMTDCRPNREPDQARQHARMPQKHEVTSISSIHKPDQFEHKIKNISAAQNSKVSVIARAGRRSEIFYT